MNNSGRKAGSTEVAENQDGQKGSATALIEKVESIIEFQVTNGLLEQKEAEELIALLSVARALLTTDAGRAQELALRAYTSLMNVINSKPLKDRLKYMYAAPVWGYLSAVIAIALVLIGSGALAPYAIGGVPLDTVLWGLLGGCVYPAYHLRKNVYELSFSKYYAVYYLVYPLVGAVFGVVISLIFAAGLLSMQGKPTYAFYASLAFIAGMFQHWVVSLLYDIAEGIHKSQGPRAK